MNKVIPTIQVDHSDKAGFVKLRFPTWTDLSKKLGHIPGAVKVDGAWLCPEDALTVALAKARECGFNYVIRPEPDLSKLPPIAGQLPWQAVGTARGLLNRRLLLLYEMGLGKTRTAIDILREGQALVSLVTCPAIVRSVWIDEVAKWWPNGPTPLLIESSKDAAQVVESTYHQGTAVIIVTSYELAHHFEPMAKRLDAVILDEVHYVKSGGTKRTHTCQTILANAPRHAFRLGLTGTPITNEVEDIYWLLEAFWPGTCGNWWHFTHHYGTVANNGYGKVVTGLNPLHTKELYQRLAFRAHRVTAAEVADQLPKMTPQVVRMKPARSVNIRELTERFNRRDLHRVSVDRLVRACGVQKVGKTAELVQASTAQRILVFTHLRSTAADVAGAIPGAICITGAEIATKRKAIITEALIKPRTVIVATMDCLGMGLNLQMFTHLIFAELDYSPTKVNQAMKRVHRLGGSHVLLQILVAEGTLDEAICAILIRKLKDHKQVVKQGASEATLEEMLDDKITDDDIAQLSAEIAKGAARRDRYA